MEISLSEMTKRAEDAEYQVLRSKLHEEEEVIVQHVHIVNRSHHLVI